MPTTPAPPTATVVSYPSTLLPTLPPFIFAVPSGWVLDQAPGALAVIRLPEQVDGFWINAMLSTATVARDVTITDAAASAWERLLERMPDATIKIERFLDVSGRPVLVRGSEMTSPEGRAISQLHASFLAPVNGPGRVVDLFDIVCTVPTEHADEYGPQMLSIIQSFRFV